MATYTYTAKSVEAAGSKKGTMEADSELELANKLRGQGYILIKAEEEKEATTKKKGKLKFKELIPFTIHLSAFLDAGIPLLEALSDAAKTSGTEESEALISDIYDRVKEGASLSGALSTHPGSFSELYIALVGSGEATGKLDTVLENLASFLEWTKDLRGKVKEAATYPIVLICAMMGVVTLLVVKVIPTFEPFFEKAGVTLPLPTRIVLGVSHIFQQYWYILLIIAGGGFFALWQWYKTEKGKYIIDSLKLKMPLFGKLIKKISISRFAHTLSLSLQSGVTILRALDTSARVVGNAKIEEAVSSAKDSVNVGEELADALEATGQFPTLIIKMVRVGEKSGSLSESLDKVSGYYDKEVPSVINRIFTLMEPIMIICIGVVVGGIAISIFLPLFQMAQTIGG